MILRFTCIFTLILGLFFAPLKSARADAAKKTIIFAYSDSIHLWGDHENKISAEFLAETLKKSYAGKIEAKALYLKSDSDFEALRGADAVIVFGEGEKHHPFYKRENLIKKLNDSGVSFGFIHYALQPDDSAGYEVLDAVLGGHYEPYYSVNPSFEAKFESFAPHPVSSGVKSFAISDEWYFNIKFPDADRVRPIAKVVPPDRVRKGRDGPHSGNAVVRGNLGAAESILWVCENPNKTRGFGFTGGHCLFNFLNDDYRKLLLNACLWLAKVEAPEGGVESPRPSFEELESKIEKPLRRDIEHYKKRVEESAKKWNLKQPEN